MSAPDGFVIHSFAGDDAIACRDFVRARCGADPFKPAGNGNGRRATASPMPSDEVRKAANERKRAALAKAAQQASDGGGGPEKSKVVVATYDYRDADGALLYQVVRYQPKCFRQRRPDGNGGWIWNLTDVKRVPYRLPEMIDDDQAVIFQCEGEKDVGRLLDLGLCATTVNGGARWTPELAEHFRNREIVVLPDFDSKGVKRALEAANALQDVAQSIRVVVLPGLDGATKNRDVSDWLDRDAGNAERFADIWRAAPLWTPGLEVEGMAAAAAVNAKETGADATSEIHRPLIVVQAGALQQTASDVEAALINAGCGLYARGGVIVRAIVELVPAFKGRKTHVTRLKT
jgi:hypothetical protein